MLGRFSIFHKSDIFKTLDIEALYIFPNMETMPDKKSKWISADVSLVLSIEDGGGVLSPNKLGQT